MSQSILPLADGDPGSEGTAGPPSAGARSDLTPSTAHQIRRVPDRIEPVVRPWAGLGSIGSMKAWMVLLPVDAVALAAPALWVPAHFKGLLAWAALSLVLLFMGGCYRPRLHVSVLDELPALLGRVLTAAAVIATIFALWHDQDEVMVFLGTGIVGIGLLVVGRMITSSVILTARRRRIVCHRTVVVGGGVEAAELMLLLDRYPQYGLFPVGYVGPTAGPAAVAASRLGGLDDLDRVVRSTSSDVILVADGEHPESALLDALRSPALAHCDLMQVPRMHQFCRQSGADDHIGSIPIVRIHRPRLRGPARVVKRGADILVSGVVLLVLAPLLTLCAIAVRLEGGPGVLFRQERVGRDGKLFTCLKFRSMRPATAEESATNWSIAADSRVGRVGKVLRRTGLDELPQLWNILVGDMTLIGPRPERPHFVMKFSEEFPTYRHRHRVRAGLTGLAQVSGLRGDTPIADRARFDNYYIENWSLWLDFKILLRTFSEVFLARGR
ncbi:sugar transferase [Pseudonocardia ailaonensis]